MSNKITLDSNGFPFFYEKLSNLFFFNSRLPTAGKKGFASP